MILPDYWLKRPNLEIAPQIRLEFDQLFSQLKSNQMPVPVNYDFPVPKWQFLCYVADQHGVALHGTGTPDIQVFEPRPSNDLEAFGAQTAVYAAADGLWAMFFAILDREHYKMSTSNACIRLADESGAVSEPWYVFSVSQAALQHLPYRKGWIYLLPGETFMHQPSLRFSPYEVRVPQLASLVPVKPFGLLEVTPDDFPFLKDIRGLDDGRLEEYGQAMQTGAPWPE